MKNCPGSGDRHLALRLSLPKAKTWRILEICESKLEWLQSY
jgi:hypothetical protein